MSSGHCGGSGLSITAGVPTLVNFIWSLADSWIVSSAKVVFFLSSLGVPGVLGEIGGLEDAVTGVAGIEGIATGDEGTGVADAGDPDLEGGARVGDGRGEVLGNGDIAFGDGDSGAGIGDGDLGVSDLGFPLSKPLISGLGVIDLDPGSSKFSDLVGDLTDLELDDLD